MLAFSLGNGFIAANLNYDILTSRLSSYEDVKNAASYLASRNVTSVVNCIGYNGNKSIDDCENDRSKTHFTNTQLPLMIADALSKHNIHLIHISTGCIFYGPSPNSVYTYHEVFDSGWKEDDATLPKSFYSRTKLAADLILDQMPNTTILRIRMPASPLKHNRNIITKVSRYNQILSAKNSYTFTNDLKNVVDFFVKEKIPGIFHVTNPEPLCLTDFAYEYQLYNKNYSFTPVNESKADSLVKVKRSTCIINCDKLNSLGITLTPSIEALKQTMKQYVEKV